MALLWSDQNRIAEALVIAYPETDRAALPLETLCSMITSLPGFADAAMPPKTAYLNHILWTWMRLADHGMTADTGGGRD